MKAEYHKKANLRIVLRANGRHAVQTKVLEEPTNTDDGWRNLIGAGKLTYAAAIARMNNEASNYGG
jgi:hypothetical protein